MLLFYIPLVSAKINPVPETILVEGGSAIEYPSTQSVEIIALMNGLFYNCTVMLVDLFMIENLTNYPHRFKRGYYMKTAVDLIKIAGRSGDQEICHIGSRIKIRVEKCKLKRTAKGIPKALNCRFSLRRLFEQLS